MNARCPRCEAPIPGPQARFCVRCGAPFKPLSSRTEIASGLATLVVQEGARAWEVPLSARALTLGRADDNDVVLQARFVSNHHCRVEFDGGRHHIVDAGSRNGVVYNGRRVDRHELAHGDVVRLADPTTANSVSFTYVASDAAPELPGVEAVQRRALPRSGRIVLGREGCDLNLDHPQVSRRHAAVTATADGHTLEDLGSTNGTWLDETRVKGRVALKPGSVLRVGPFKLVYDGAALDQYDLRGAMRLHAAGLWRVVGSGAKVKALLRDVSLSVEPREFVALVGGSGAGKSTLLGALAGYARATTGVLKVNGEDYYARFDDWRAALGYVPQDDVLHKDLVVTRALMYAARLRLPADTSDAEIEARVTRVLDAVEMTAHREKFVSDLSGGQRKRVSIAAELLADPSLFFLDEPTSGLDPGLEKKMMYTLRRLADGGRTVVLVTHATANITRCDHVAFMAEGRLVYFGPPTEALGFFGVTSGDFADIYSKLDGPAAPASPLVRTELQDEYNRWRKDHPDATDDPPPPLAALWELRYRASPQHRKYVAERLGEVLQPSREPPSPSSHGTARIGAKRGSSALGQFVLLTRRYAELVAHDRKNLAILLAQAPVIGALLCLVAKSGTFEGANSSAPEARKVLFVLATVAVWFGIINAAREIAKEAAIYRRERLATLRIGPYLLSKFAVLGALTLVQTAALMGVLQAHFAFSRNGVVMLASPEIFVTTLLASLASLGFGLLLSALAATPDKAMSAVPLALVPQILFAGNIFKLEGASTALSWLTVSRWAFDAYGATADLNHMRYAPGARTMAQYGLAETAFTPTSSHLLSRWAALGAQMVVCLALTALVLRRRDPR